MACSESIDFFGWLFRLSIIKTVKLSVATILQTILTCIFGPTKSFYSQNKSTLTPACKYENLRIHGIEL